MKRELFTNTVKYNQGGICKAASIYISEKTVRTLEGYWYKWSPYHIENLSAVQKQNGGHQVCQNLYQNAVSRFQ